jgi:antitoxin ChpS
MLERGLRRSYTKLIERRCAMHVARLRKVGEAVMLAVPQQLLDLLHLQAGATIGLAVAQGCLLVSPNHRPRYTLAELLAASDYSHPLSGEDREWLDAPAVGRELL